MEESRIGVGEVDAGWHRTMSRLAICVATMSASTGNHVGDIPTWRTHAKELLPVYTQHNTPEDNLGVIGSYQKLYEQTNEELLMFIHDDVICREEGWDERVIKEFGQTRGSDRRMVGVVGFGGALEHGTGDLYKTPYRLQQLARNQYYSNVDDSEVHGQRFTGSMEAAVIDGFCIIVRRSLLERVGGWPVDRYPPHHNYDYWICAMAHRLGFSVRVVGIRCHHHGGRTAVSPEYLEWAKKTKWGSDSKMHEEGHRLIYEDFRDQLPYRVGTPR